MKQSATISFVQAAVLVGSFALIALLMFAAGTQCGGGPGGGEPVETGIDAGPGEREIAERLDGSIRHEQAEIDRIEREYAAEIASFDAAQREKYERLQEQDLDDVVRYLQHWHQERNSRGD